MDDKFKKCIIKYSCSFMSNAKWYKLFNVILNSGILIKSADWKFIDSDIVSAQPFPTLCQVSHSGLKDGITQPVEYKWIESIFVPAAHKPLKNIGHTTYQNVNHLNSVIIEAGNFPVELSESGLYICAYK